MSARRGMAAPAACPNADLRSSPADAARADRWSGIMGGFERMDDDAELLARWQRGDAEAGEALIERHTPRLYRFFAAAVTDGAEDLCQQTFAACFEAKAGIVEDAAGGKSFRSFLFTVARRRLINHYRGRGRNEAKLDPLEQSVA